MGFDPSPSDPDLKRVPKEARLNSCEVSQSLGLGSDSNQWTASRATPVPEKGTPLAVQADSGEIAVGRLDHPYENTVLVTKSGQRVPLELMPGSEALRFAEWSAAPGGRHYEEAKEILEGRDAPLLGDPVVLSQGVAPLTPPLTPPSPETLAGIRRVVEATDLPEMAGGSGSPAMKTGVSSPRRRCAHLHDAKNEMQQAKRSNVPTFVEFKSLPMPSQLQRYLRGDRAWCAHLMAYRRPKTGKRTQFVMFAPEGVAPTMASERQLPFIEDVVLPGALHAAVRGTKTKGRDLTRATWTKVCEAAEALSLPGNEVDRAQLSFQ